MKLENPGYRLNQRLDKGTKYGIFQWKGKITSQSINDAVILSSDSS